MALTTMEMFLNVTRRREMDRILPLDDVCAAFEELIANADRIDFRQ